MLNKITKTLELPYAPAQMFALVDRVEDYPLFLPGCLKSQVHSRSPEVVKASLQVGKGLLRYSVSTLNRLQTPKRIDMQLLAGPLKHLEGFWLFEASTITAEGCRISLNLNFELNPLLHKTLEPFVEKIGDRIIQAFCERAAVLYG